MTSTAFLASQGHLQKRYSYAAVVLASRTGKKARPTHFAPLKVAHAGQGFENADNMLNEKQNSSNSEVIHGWLTYNMARCKFGLADFEAAINLYNETIEMKSTDAETTLKAYIGLNYAHQRLGNSLMAEFKADEYAASTQTCLGGTQHFRRGQVEETEETKLSITQTDLERSCKRIKKNHYSLKYPRKARHAGEPWKSTRLARQRDSQRSTPHTTVHSLTINEQPVLDERQMQNPSRIGWETESCLVYVQSWWRFIPRCC